MADMVRIRRVEEFWNDFVYEGQKQGLKNEQIRRNLVEAFRKEIFDTIMFRARITDLDELVQDEKNTTLVNNIFKQELNKWKKLVAECKRHFSTMMLIKESDLTLFDKEEDDEDGGYEIGEAEDPEEVDEMTAEWPELSEEESENEQPENDIPENADEACKDGLEEGPDKPEQVPDEPSCAAGMHDEGRSVPVTSA